MSKILCLNKGLLYQGYLFSKSLKNHFDEVHLLQGAESQMQWDYPLDMKDFMLYSISWDDAIAQIHDYDCIFAVEAGSLVDMLIIKTKYPKIKAKTGVQVLDYPIHALAVGTKDYKPNVASMWNFIKPNLNNVDFIAHEKYAAIDLLKEFQTEPLVERVGFPVNMIETGEIEQQDYIFYSGRAAADKGIHSVLSALSIIDEDIPFKVAGNGYDYSGLAEHLRVDYEQISHCSESDKWQMYKECRFVVCGADNPYITALCILEGISVGRAGLVEGHEENRKHFLNNSWYCQSQNVKSLASAIKFMWINQKHTNITAEAGPDWIQKNYTYDVWAKQIYELYGRVK